jgi:hypothetical protein
MFLEKIEPFIHFRRFPAENPHSGSAAGSVVLQTCIHVESDVHNPNSAKEK